MTKAVANIEKARGIMAYIHSKSRNIEELLPKYLTPERMFRIASLALTKQPLLMQCQPSSFVVALMDAARSGLEPNGKDAALVPYGNQVQFQPMYHGMIKQAVRTGAVKKIDSVLVHANDKFKYWRDPEPHIEHYPALEDEGELIGAYAYAVMPDDSLQVVFMNRKQLEHVRKKSKSSSGPWSTDPEEMYRKCPVKRLFKYLPANDELEYAVAADNAIETGSRSSIPFVELENEESAPQKTKTEKIKEQLNKQPDTTLPPEMVAAPVELSTVKGSITDDQVDRIESLCTAKGLIVTACLPDGVNNLMDCSQTQAEEIVNRVREL